MSLVSKGYWREVRSRCWSEFEERVGIPGFVAAIVVALVVAVVTLLWEREGWMLQLMIALVTPTVLLATLAYYFITTPRRIHEENLGNISRIDQDRSDQGKKCQQLERDLRSIESQLSKSKSQCQQLSAENARLRSPGHAKTLAVTLGALAWGARWLIQDRDLRQAAVIPVADLWLKEIPEILRESVGESVAVDFARCITFGGEIHAGPELDETLSRKATYLKQEIEARLEAGTLGVLPGFKGLEWPSRRVLDCVFSLIQSGQRLLPGENWSSAAEANDTVQATIVWSQEAGVTLRMFVGGKWSRQFDEVSHRADESKTTVDVRNALGSYLEILEDLVAAIR